MDASADTIALVIQQATQQLHEHSDSAQLDVELLLCSVLKKDRSFFRAWPEHKMADKDLFSFKNLLSERLQGKPIAHILGERGFWSLNLKVTKDTLIPRPDTERLVELALEHIPAQASWRLLDLGTGTGAIALSLAKECSTCQVTATDQSRAALEVAQINAKENNINNIDFIKSDWFGELDAERFNMIVSNPPYIKENDPHLKQGDVRFEPLSALTSGEDGLNDIRDIIQNSQNYLTEKGVLLLEHGYDQAEEVCLLLTQAGFHNVRNIKDDNDIPRVSIGTKSP
ncbi:MAG: peptide chain release factor N(5)-glutamine methyltransferase [Woeseiaceae bacterium]